MLPGGQPDEPGPPSPFQKDEAFLRFFFKPGLHNMASKFNLARVTGPQALTSDYAHDAVVGEGGSFDTSLMEAVNMSACQPVESKVTVALELEVNLDSGCSEPGACFAEWRCPTCHEVMEIHQPDMGNPGRLLGTCPECGAWAVWDEVAGPSAGYLLLIPEPARLRALLERAGAGLPQATPSVV